MLLPGPVETVREPRFRRGSADARFLRAGWPRSYTMTCESGRPDRGIVAGWLVCWGRRCVSVQLALRRCRGVMWRSGRNGMDLLLS